MDRFRTIMCIKFVQFMNFVTDSNPNTHNVSQRQASSSVIFRVINCMWVVNAVGRFRSGFSLLSSGIEKTSADHSARKTQWVKAAPELKKNTQELWVYSDWIPFF
jgi:hypothetical protein